MTQIPSKICPVAKWREGGGSCQPETWTECTICGAHQEASCKLTEKSIADHVGNFRYANEKTPALYGEYLDHATRLVKELVRQERLKETPNKRPTKPNKRWFKWSWLALIFIIVINLISRFYK